MPAFGFSVLRLAWPQALLMIVIFVPMLIEARRSARNERAQRARGGIEPGDDVYGLMRVAYPGCFVAMLAEGALREPSASAVLAGMLVFAAAKAIKWWAILSLGPSWTFKVIAVPGAPLVTSGPYRFLRHPNYVGVVGELAGAAIMTHASITGPLATALFIVLIWRRIDAEERALHLRG
jgi:methyltransferase